MEIIGKKLSENSDKSEWYGTKWNILSKHKIINWEYNRPYDNKRIPEIAEQLKKQDYVDGVIYLFQRDNQIICYDGIHRIEALKYLDNTIENNKIKKCNHKIIVHFYPFYNEEIIKHRFVSLNKCIVVPEIYTKAHKLLDIKTNIEHIVKHFHTKYNNMFKSSSRPNIPHENRDIFTDKIQHILEELQISNEQDFIQMFENFNNHLRENINHFKVSKKQIEKCNNNNCYFFIKKDWNYQFVNLYRRKFFK
jgi:hypothetical protein